MENESLEKASTHSGSNDSVRSGSGRRKLLSDNLVKGPKKSGGNGSMKSNDTTSTAASDADRAQRRIERAQLLEKKKAHEERRRKVMRDRQKNKKLEKTSSEGSLDARELKANHSDGGALHNSYGSMDSSSAKSILKNGKFSNSNVVGGNKVKKNRSRNSESSNCSLTGSTGNSKTGGVSFAETTVFHVTREESRGPVVMHRDDPPRSRHHADEFELLKQQPVQDPMHIDEEARSRRHVEIPGSSEYFEHRRQRQIPYQHDSRRLRNPSGQIPNRHQHQHAQEKAGRRIGNPNTANYRIPSQNGHMIARHQNGRPSDPRAMKPGQMQKPVTKHEGNKIFGKRKGDNASTSSSSSTSSLTKAQLHMKQAKAAFASVPH